MEPARLCRRREILRFVQLTAITGIFGLSLLVASYSALTAWVALGFLNGEKRGLVLWPVKTAALIVIALAGPTLVPQAQADHVAHLVQTNFPVATTYPANWMQTHAGEMDDLERISVDAAQKESGVVVWPEVPAPFSLQDANFLARATRIARGAKDGFLVGVVDWKPLPGGGIGANNSAALLGSDGALNFIYDKIHLVPFSEYVPWRKWLFFAQDLTGLIGDFQHGTQYKVGRVDGGSFSVYICFEGIFPNEVRRFTLAGAQVLDQYFGRRMVWRLWRARAAPGDGARARGGKSPLAVARYQHRSHGIGGPLRPHRRAPACQYSRRT